MTHVAAFLPPLSAAPFPLGERTVRRATPVIRALLAYAKRNRRSLAYLSRPNQTLLLLWYSKKGGFFSHVSAFCRFLLLIFALLITDFFTKKAGTNIFYRS